MVGRLLIGIVKGLILGALIGYGLVRLGLGIPGALWAYPAAALTGVLVGLIAGKPIWAKDAKIEAGTKAVVGALLALGLMAAARTWLQFPLPFSLGPLAPEHATVGGFAMSSLAAIAALLGGFYEADNDSSSEEAEPKAASERAKKKGPQRIAPAVKSQGEDEEELEIESDRKRSKK